MLSLVYMPERKTPFRWPYGIGNVLTLFPSSKQFGLPRPPRGSPPPPFNKQKAPLKEELRGCQKTLCPVHAVTFRFVCRGRCQHRPGRPDCFFGNLRRIRSFPTGRCRHRPLSQGSPFRGGSPGANPPPIHQKTTLKFVENNPYFFLRRGLWCGMIRKTEKV